MNTVTPCRLVAWRKSQSHCPGRGHPGTALRSPWVEGVQPDWSWSCRWSTEGGTWEEGALWGLEDHEWSAQ